MAVDELLHFPDSVPFATMAAVPVQGLTAWGLVHFVANVRPSDVVLLHAAAGGVGQLAVQLARRAGARVLGTASTDQKAAIVRRLANAFGYSWEAEQERLPPARTLHRLGYRGPGFLVR